MVSYNIQRYHSDPEYRKRVREKEKARFNAWLKNNPDYHKEYYLRRKNIMNTQAREYHKLLLNGLREQLIIIVQGYVKCNLCPIDDPVLLEFHHIKVNGDKDRKRFKRKCHIRSNDFDKIKWLKHMIKYYHEEKNTYPLQVLCGHCHKKISAEFGHHNKKTYEENLITLTNFIA